MVSDGIDSDDGCCCCRDALGCHNNNPCTFHLYHDNDELNAAPVVVDGCAFAVVFVIYRRLWSLFALHHQ